MSMRIRIILIFGIVVFVIGILDFSRREPAPWQLLSSIGRAGRMQSYVFSDLELDKGGDIQVKVARYKPNKGEPSEERLNSWAKEQGYVDSREPGGAITFKMFLMSKGYDDLASRYVYTTSGFSMEIPHIFDLIAAVIGFLLLISSLFFILAHHWSSSRSHAG